MSHELLTSIPSLPGVYLFKDQDGAVIYIGKAKSLRARLRSYFSDKNADWKVHDLLKEYRSIAHIVTTNEVEALLLEAKLVKEYQPKYNVLLKEGDPFLYLFISDQELPTLQVVRIKKKRGIYFGPFLHKKDARQAAEYLMRTFILKRCKGTIQEGCLDYHLGQCAGVCTKTFDANDYRLRIELARRVLEGNHKEFLRTIFTSIEEYKTKRDFEKAQHLYEYTQHFETIFATIKTHFSDTKYVSEVVRTTTPVNYKPQEYLFASKDLQQLLVLEKEPKVIDCFDISHFQSTHLVGSCVRFVDGSPDKNKFRRFAIKKLTIQNDYAALQEIVTRRYQKGDYPDLILIDGGKGQRNAVLSLRLPVPIISLAKKEERLFSEHYPEGTILNLHRQGDKIIIALRDYAHHFAITYHKLLRKKALHNTITTK
jgi:excinuclease ABC subunit C